MNPRSLTVFLLVIALLCGGAWIAINALRVGETPVPGAVDGDKANARSDLPTDARSSAVTGEHGEDRREVATGGGSTATDPVVATPEDAAKSACVLHGKVVDARGVPIAGAKVAQIAAREASMGAALGLPREFLEADLQGTTTDRDGGFEIRLQELGAFELVATHDEHPRARRSGKADGPRLDDFVIEMRDGGSIEGRLLNLPADAGKVVIVARLVDESIASAAADKVRGALLDIGDLVEEMGVPIGARTGEVDAQGAFALRGLDAGARFTLFATKVDEAVGDVQRCSEKVDVREGARGVELHWRETLQIELRVVDAASGAPIEQLDVSAGPMRKVTVFGITSSVPMQKPLPRHEFPGGVVRIAGIDVGDSEDPVLAIEVRAAGHRTWSRDDLHVPARGHVDLGTAPLPRASVVRVQVLAAGKPLEGAEVALKHGDGQGDDSEASGSKGFRVSTTVRTPGDEPTPDSASQARSLIVGDDEGMHRTDAQGRCEITADFDGDARLIVQADGFATWRGEPFALPAQGAVDREVVLSAGGSAHVRVVDGHGAAVADAGFVCRRKDGGEESRFSTDPHGEWTVQHLTPGEHEFELAATADDSKVHFTIDGVPDAKHSDAVLATITEGGVTEVELRQPLRGSLTGIVTLDGQALDGAQVRVVAPEGTDIDPAQVIGASLGGLFGGLVDLKDKQTATSDDSGRFTLDGVVVGPRRLIVTHRDLSMPHAEEITIAEGENRHDIALRGTVLRGRVLGPDGKPLEGVAINVARDTADADQVAAGLQQAGALLGEMFGGGGAHDAARSDASGAFEVRGVQSGVPLRVRASGKSYVADSVAVAAIEAGAVREGVELHLALAGRIRVRCTVDGALAVKAEWAGGDPKPKGITSQSALLKNGRAVLDSLPPGRWKLSLERSNPERGTGEERLVEVTAGVLANVEF